MIDDAHKPSYVVGMTHHIDYNRPRTLCRQHVTSQKLNDPYVLVHNTEMMACLEMCNCD